MFLVFLPVVILIQFGAYTSGCYPLSCHYGQGCRFGPRRVHRLGPRPMHRLGPAPHLPQALSLQICGFPALPGMMRGAKEISGQRRESSVTVIGDKRLKS